MVRKLVASFFFVGVALLTTGCGDDIEAFVGSYSGTLTIQGGAGSETHATSISIQEGSTADLVISIDDAQGLRASVTGDSTFRIPSQQTTISGTAANISGTGSVNGGALNITGQIHAGTQVYSYVINATKL